MKVAIHQPEFMPWLGYFHKMREADTYIILDNVQFKKRYFENRNYIKNPINNTKEWVTVPVITKGRYNQHISDVEILYEEDWGKKITHTLTYKYGSNEVTNSFNEMLYSFSSSGNKSLLELNLRIIFWFRKQFNINTPLIYQSDLGINSKGSNLVLDICKSVKATSYICGTSGNEYLDFGKFKDANISIKPQNYNEPQYNNSGLTQLSSYDFVQEFGLNCFNEFNKLI